MRLIKIGVGVALLAALTGGGVAWATSGGEENVTGPEAERARAAALAHVGGGTAIGVERESGAWEVEIRTDDGPIVEVTLDGSYRVTGGDSDGSEGDDSDGNESGEDESSE
ncbi:MAG: hypothetical protein ACRDON_11215 [Gaiellaceae bacterium]